jgi:uncharacterized protein
MQSEKIKVVLDSNIIVSATISIDGAPGQIFRLVLEDKLINYTTEEIINEVRKVFDKPFFKDRISDEYKKEFLELFMASSIIVIPEYNESVSEHRADDKFINCALTAKADIVSGDKHLLDIKSYKGITFFNCQDFLKEIAKDIRNFGLHANKK